MGGDTGWSDTTALKPKVPAAVGQGEQRLAGLLEPGNPRRMTGQWGTGPRSGSTVIRLARK